MIPEVLNAGVVAVGMDMYIVTKDHKFVVYHTVNCEIYKSYKT